jgi:site-specific DNA-methyltransferase (adenine-specific)
MLDNIDYNPDVLTCLANLSNDEVFTPPELVNDILDLLPKELFESKETTFLDPVTKSGVFLREIAKRLMNGLEKKIPDKQERINHIFKNQVFGIAITELTSLLARRSLYCSKTANGKYSVCEEFDNEQGNILFERIEHTWKDGKCLYCGASEKNYARGIELETHAYQFIHTENQKELFNMKFDVIIGNPPYQLSTGGSGVQATPIYNKFIQQAKKLNPRFISMITPARWFSGGFGLDSFRKDMLTDNRLVEIHDYPEAADCFPGVQIKGGVCYFLWDRDNPGLCGITTHRGNDIGTRMERSLLEDNNNFFIRYNEAIGICHKVSSKKESCMSEMVSQQKPFGFPTTYKGDPQKNTNNYITVYGSKGIGYCSISDVSTNIDLISRPKVFISSAGSGSDKFPHPILGRPFIPSENSACTETYVVIHPLNSYKECENIIDYISTRFFRFLVMLKKPTQHALRKVYSLVPMQNFSESWTDEKLYKKYGLDEKEIEFIESMIRPMELDSE